MPIAAQCGQAPPTAANVTITDTVGATPTANPPAQAPVEGDVYINRVDGAMWVFGPDPVTGNPVWARVPTGTTGVTITDTATATPQTFVPPLSPGLGDIFINRADGLSWVFGTDDATSVQMWEPLAASGVTTALQSVASGEVPENPDPARGEVQFTFPAGYTPSQGDTFHNTADQRQWVYSQDPTTAGQFVWSEWLATVARGTTVYVGDAAFDPNNVVAPFYGMDPATLPNPGLSEPFGGDIYVSTHTGTITTLLGPAPVPMPVLQGRGRQQVIYVGTAPFVLPLPPNTQPDPLIAVPEPGDVYFSTATGQVTVLT